MTELTAPISVLGSGVCIPNEDIAARHGFSDAGFDTSILPSMVRRRTSNATRAAITAAVRACNGISREMPAIFVSCAGEMQGTDRLCNVIAKEDFPLSPTQFHNSVHNTAGGYWSIATGSMAAVQAMGAMQDGFALGLLEAWCQLNTLTDRVLLVVYDEEMPRQLLPGYKWETCAFALVLECATRTAPLLGRPFMANGPGSDCVDFPAMNPAMSALPLFLALRDADAGQHLVVLSAGKQAWHTRMLIP